MGSRFIIDERSRFKSEPPLMRDWARVITRTSLFLMLNWRLAPSMFHHLSHGCGQTLQIRPEWDHAYIEDEHPVWAHKPALIISPMLIIVMHMDDLGWYITSNQQIKSRGPKPRSNPQQDCPQTKCAASTLNLIVDFLWVPMLLSLSVRDTTNTQNSI